MSDYIYVMSTDAELRAKGKTKLLIRKNHTFCWRPMAIANYEIKSNSVNVLTVTSKSNNSYQVLIKFLN